MISRILVAMDDSGPAMAAATLAVDLARGWGADLHFVSVTKSEHQAERLLRHVATRARQAGLEPLTTITNGGHPFEVLLSIAADWEADLIVMGRSDIRRPGVPYVGSQTEHLLEFTHVPVLVVPHQPPPRSASIFPRS